MRAFSATLLTAFIACSLVVAACGGGSSKTYTGSNGESVKVTTDKPPSDFPSDFPIYSGATYQGAVTSSERGVNGTVATWTTKDSVDKVNAFYTDAFKNGPWHSSSTVNSGGGAFVSVQRQDDPNSTGFVTVAGEGDTTTIGIFVGKGLGGTITAEDSPSGKTTPSSSSSGDDTPGPGDAALPAEVSLASDYPKDRAPIPSGARITASSSLANGSDKIFTLEFYSKDSAKSLADYFKSEYPKHGWVQALASEQSGLALLTWTGDGETGITVSIKAADVAGYQQAAMVLTVHGS